MWTRASTSEARARATSWRCRCRPARRGCCCSGSCGRSGAAVLPLDHRLRPAEVRSILDRARPGLVLDADGATVRTEGLPVDEGTGLVLATSGTAGMPKVVELARGAVEAAVAASDEALGIGPSEPWLCCLPLAHVGGLLVLLRGRADRRAGRGPPGVRPRGRRRARHADHVSLVPTMLTRLLEAGADLGRFRTILVGGAALADPAADAARARGARVVDDLRAHRDLRRRRLRRRPGRGRRGAARPRGRAPARAGPP